MASRTLKRYGLEGIAKILIAIGFLLVLSAWVAGVYYFGTTGTASFIAPFIFTCVLVATLLVIKYRYTMFEKYPYLMNLPSIFYRIGDQKDGKNKQSLAFSMIFTVHSLVIAFLGLLSLVLTFSIGSSINSKGTAWWFFYVYLAIIAILIISVLYQYRRIYRKFVK